MSDATLATSPSNITLDTLRGNPKRRRRESFIRRAFLAAAGLSIVINVLIVLSLLDGTLEFLRNVDLGSLWSRGWFPRRGLYDIRTIVAGTLLVSVIAMAVAAPLDWGPPCSSPSTRAAGRGGG